MPQRTNEHSDLHQSEVQASIHLVGAINDDALQG